MSLDKLAEDLKDIVARKVHEKTNNLRNEYTEHQNYILHSYEKINDAIASAEANIEKLEGQTLLINSVEKEGYLRGLLKAKETLEELSGPYNVKLK